jgi:hypothetical protein
MGRLGVPDRSGREEPTKVPYNVTGGKADTTIPATWGTFDDALLVAQNGTAFAGIGYVFAENDPFTGVDLDECLDGDVLHPEAALIVGALDSYTEISPSGTGVKIWVEASKHGVTRCQTSDTPWGGKLEAYDRDRFFTVTGHVLRGCPNTINANQNGLDLVLAQMFGSADEVTYAQSEKPLLIPADDKLLERALAARNGDKLRRLFDGDTSLYDGDESRADAALVGALAFWSGDPVQVDRIFRRSGRMRPKWDERRRDTTYGAVTIANALRVVRERFDWTSIRNGGERVAFAEPASTSSEEIPGIAELLDMTETFVRRFVVLGEAGYVAVPLWVAHTWAIESTDTTSYLHVTSPEWESGKSRLLEVIEQLVRRPIYAASMTSAVLYRAVQSLKPELLVDEADNLFKDREAKNDLLGVLNSGWRRGALAYRIGGGNRDELQSFQTFCAKAIAGLDDLAPTLASRCVRVQMRRRRVEELIEDFYRDLAAADAKPIRDGFAAWSKAYQDTLRWSRPDRLGVRDRLEEGLRLPLAIAELAGERWTTRARDAFRELAGTSTDGAMSERVQLLTDLQVVFDANPGQDELPTSVVLQTLLDFEESPWRGWWGTEKDGVVYPGKGAAQKLAEHLKGFGIRSVQIGPREARVRGYRYADFEDAWKRYLPLPHPPPAPNPLNPLTPHDHALFGHPKSAHRPRL